MDIQTLRSKLKLTPLPIRSWFASEEVSLAIQAVNQRLSLKGEDRKIIPILLVRLETKDVEISAFVGEISKELKLDAKKASAIYNEISNVILSPIKSDLAAIGIDISLLGQPRSSSPVTLNATVTKENIIQINAGVSFIKPAPTPISIDNLSSKGWSTFSLNTPTPPSAPKFPSTAPFKSAQSTSPIPKPPTPPAPAPVILQQETPTSAAKKNADFHIAKSGTGAQMEFSKEKERVKVMPAIIEFNKAVAPAPKTPIPPAPHTEFKSSLASTPIVNSGARTVTEITSMAPVLKTPPVPMPPKPPAPPISALPLPLKPPKPLLPPTPPMPSLPPAPPKPASNNPPSTVPKVIVQDFLQQPPK